MFWINGKTAVTTRPTPRDATSTAETFATFGDPATGLPATIMDADWINMVQSELMNVVRAAGMQPNQLDYEQLYKAIRLVIASTLGVDDWDGNGTISIANATIGDIALKPFRFNELPKGWYFCNGERYATDSPQANALVALSSTFKSDWGITTTGAGTNVPDLFSNDGRGYFLRAVDNSSRFPGSNQNDAFQGHYHQLSGGSNSIQSGNDMSCMLPAAGSSSTAWQARAIITDGTNGAPRTDVETRGINIGMTPAIYLGV